ncbi:MAG: tetratricopeptide repeat protein [Planctomycetes bacterium]|nr:tetratricopeptide repeat protein [Planctomycetota bacterium]
MNPHLERGILLYQQSRHDLAEAELRQALAGDPHDSYPHALLALCLAERKDLKEATKEAQRAIQLAPDFDYAHFAHARVLCRRNMFPEARAAIEEALRLDPEDADYYSLLAGIHLEERHWQDALNAAEQGLKFDAEHVSCTNLRAVALVKLGRKSEAGATIGAALARNPESAPTHANQGWTLLESGDEQKALEHFREAMRLDPESKWARAGIVEALKARSIIYALMLKYFLWISKLSRQAQWGIVLGAFFGNRLLTSIAESNPALAPWVLPLQIIYVVFAVLSWTAYPIFNLLLRFSRVGRQALTPDQIVESNWVGVACLLAMVSLGGCIATGFRGAWLFSLVVFGLLLLPLSGLFRCSKGWPRTTMIAVLIGLTLLGMAAIATIWHAHVGNDLYVKAALERAKTLLGIYSISALASMIFANYIEAHRPRQ